MAIISANLQFNRGGHGLLDYSSLQNNYSAALLWAQDVNSNAAVGQFIYLENAETIEGVEYAKGPYVVDAIGEGAVLTPLSKSVAGNPDLASLVSNLQSEVGTLKSGLATTDSSVNTLESKVAALPSTIVSDVKDASGNSLVVDGVATLGDYATKSELESAIGGIDFSTLATKTEVSEGLAKKVDVSAYDSKMEQVDASIAEKADASTVYTKDEVNNSLNLKADASNVYAKSETYTQSEVNNLLANKADASNVYTKDEVDDAIKGVIEQIPAAPFQSVVEGDKVLTLADGVLSSTLSYAREEVEGVDSLVLKGIDGVVIGSVPVADFVADGMLESVTPVEGTNKFKFTFKKVDGSTEDFEVDFGKFVDTYHADGVTLELNSDTNTFNVKAGVFEAAGAAAQALTDAQTYVDNKVDGKFDASGAAAAVESKLDEYKTSNDAAVAAKVDSSDYNAKMSEIVGSISTINASLETKAVKEDVSAALDLKANVADVYNTSTVDNLLSVKVDSSDYDAKMSEIDGSISTINTELAKKADATTVETSLNGKVDKVEGSSLVSDTLITKLDNMVEIKSVEGDLTFADGALSLDLSAYATIADTSANFVQKDGNKVLSTNDFTNELKTKLEGIEAGAEVNYVKSVGDNLAVDGEGKLTVDLSAYATGEELSDGLATKLDASAKVNGVSFANGEATLDAGDIALEAAITRTGEDGEVENVYAAEVSIQSVLASLSQRIDVLDPNVSGELGITSIVEGNGVKVETSGGQATISVKASAVEGNMAEVKTDGVYVQDMRSYWEAI